MSTINDRGFPYIVQWGEKVMGSSRSYIISQIERAIVTGAPANATFEDHDNPGTWRTTDDVSNAGVRVTLGLDPLAPTAPAALRNYHGEITSQQVATGLDNYQYEIRFPDMYSAAGWAYKYKITGRVKLRDAGGWLFNQPIAVILQPE